MKERRKALAKAVERSVVPASLSGAIDGEDSLPQGDVDMEMADEEDIAVRVFRSVINGPGSQILQAVLQTKRRAKIVIATRSFTCRIITRTPILIKGMCLLAFHAYILLNW